jgi:hypothetical protein
VKSSLSKLHGRFPRLPGVVTRPRCYHCSAISVRSDEGLNRTALPSGGIEPCDHFNEVGLIVTANGLEFEPHADARYEMAHIRGGTDASILDEKIEGDCRTDRECFARLDKKPFRAQVTNTRRVFWPVAPVASPNNPNTRGCFHAFRLSRKTSPDKLWASHSK